MIVSAVHDIAECIVGDITPHDNVTPEDKHKREMDAMEKLVKNLPGGYMFKYTYTYSRRAISICPLSK